jgi:UDP-glucose:glycoprotein glucosyltransferase
MTKEPKLVRARQIPEWDLYDQEIARFAARLSAEEGVVAASVDDLAADNAIKVGAGVDVKESEAEEVGIEDGHRLADEL